MAVGRLRTFWLALGFGVAIAVGGAQAQGLSLVERFGPDGLPFTHDDPLQAGGGASKVRFGAMAGDGDSEEPGLAQGKSAHGHGSPGHPSEAGTQTVGLNEGNHVPRPTPADHPSKFVLEKPFDLTIWVGGVNLGTGEVARFRAFPSDSQWLAVEPRIQSVEFLDDNKQVQTKSYSLGWVDGWSGDDTDMAKVTAQGVKDLHLEFSGLRYRDVKHPNGLGIGVKWETIDSFPKFAKRAKDKFNRIDMYAQQSYVEAWVQELMNLNSREAGLAGNFVIDVAGLQINAHFKKVVDKHPVLPCSGTLQPFFADFGGPISSFDPANVPTVSEYFLNVKWDAIWDRVEAECAGIPVPDFLKDFFEGKAKKKMQDKIAPLDLLATLTDVSEYATIQEYSGLAGGDDKNIFDRLALGVLKDFGQFKPAEWLPFKYVDDKKLMIGFEPPSGFDVKTSKEKMAETEDASGSAGGWRYNNGSTYLGKGMMLFGNSPGEDTNGPAPGNNPPGNCLADNKCGSDDIERAKVPDVLQSYAMRWLYVRLDMIDPYLADPENHVAAWREQDLISDQGPLPLIWVDWPPPNWGFGRSQVVSFRAASGGEPAPEDNHMSVDPGSALIWKGLMSIDPVTQTYSVAGALYKQDDDSNVFFFGDKNPKWGTPPLAVSSSRAHITWSQPQPIGPVQSDLDHQGSIRWLTAGVANHQDMVSDLRWGWDFDTADGAGSMDSFHAQQMSDVGGQGWGAAFVVQTNAATGAKGRTGFVLVDMNSPLN